MTSGVIFRHEDSRQEWIIPVFDEFPDLPKELDVDGRWYVKVSLPQFIALAAHEGLHPIAKEKNDDEN